MLSLTFLFWLFVVIFAVIGAMRGWARELLVSFAVILALFILSVLERFIPFVRDTLVGETRFWLRSGLVISLIFFGYQTPNIPRLAQSNRFIREHFQDTLLGLFLGGVNGYLIFGSIWFFLHDAGYPFPYITAPSPLDAMGETALKLIAIMPPTVLGSPLIYFATAIAFVFVLVVFI
ncbi:MAG: hypothetical protein PHQ40_06425 [Anaerolineaceae bacterium]|nr:hypothetical protein [Anaerolineaceae bacterium]